MNIKQNAIYTNAESNLKFLKKIHLFFYKDRERTLCQVLQITIIYFTDINFVSIEK